MKGLNGFGYAVIATSILSFFLPASEAVVVAIIPLMAAQIDLVFELDSSSFKRCFKRFYPYVFSAMAGTFLGVLMLDMVPERFIATGLGVFIILFSVSRTGYGNKISEIISDKCFEEKTIFKTALGFISGLIFGSTNIGVQVVAYLESLELDRELFIGVLAMIFLFISGLRVVMSFTLGLYSSGNMLMISALAALPGLAGIAIGQRIADFIQEGRLEKITLLMLFLIGLRLLSKAFIG